jgi:hypothetical protein
MNKFYEKTILGILCFIVVYNLVNYDIFEGNKKRRRRRRFKKKEEMRKQQMEKMRRMQNINKDGKKNQNVSSKIDTNKDNQQDKEINNLNNKINKINTSLINTQRITSEKIPSLINHINSQSDIKLNKIQEQISNNNLKNQKLKSFSEKKGRELQGNIDLLSSDLANNNIKYFDQMTEVNSKINSLQKKVNIYEKNNSNIEEMLKNVNLQLDTKYVNE